MKWFRRKVRVTSNVFVSRQVESALEKQKSLRNLFSVSKTEISDEFELFIFSSFLILLAMSIAKIDDGVQLTYTNHIVDKTEGIFGRADEEYIKRRFMEYLGAYVKDTDEQKSHLMPNTLTLALDSIHGRSDESVVKLRAGLALTIPRTLKVDVEFFDDLKIV